MNNSIVEIMTKDHKNGDRKLAKLNEALIDNNWNTALKIMHDFSDTVLYHFNHEETVLFPWYESAVNQANGPTTVMRMEHGQMRTLISELELSITNKDTARSQDIIETLNIFMQQHNSKEEGILYPMIQELSNHDDDSLVKDIINHSHSNVA